MTSEEHRALRLERINAKGWEVAQRLMKVKARQNMDISDIKGLKMDDTSESPEVRLRRWLDGINSARTRLGTHDYGKCQGCGTAFSDGRLDDMPWVENCAACEAK